MSMSMTTTTNVDSAPRPRCLPFRLLYSWSTQPRVKVPTVLRGDRHSDTDWSSSHTLSICPSITYVKSHTSGEVPPKRDDGRLTSTDALLRRVDDSISFSEEASWVNYDAIISTISFSEEQTFYHTARTRDPSFFSFTFGVLPVVGGGDWQCNYSHTSTKTPKHKHQFQFQL